MKEFYQQLLDAFANGTGTAIIAGGERWSYAQLYNAMRRLNSFLGSFQNQNIALYTGKSFEAYAGIYAVLLSGNCWVPMEPANPNSRSLDVLKLCRPAAILAGQDLPDELLAFAKNQKIEVSKLKDLIKGRNSKDFDLSLIRDDRYAYIMFTSGSTGQPKGVPVTHLNYINFVQNAMQLLPFKLGEVFADYHDFGFDLSIFYLFCCPLSGGTLAPALTDADRILPLNHIRRNRVSVVISVPSLLTRLMAFLGKRGAEPPLKTIIMAGEPFRLDQLKFCYDTMGAEHVFNFYGLTETGVENFYHRCSPNDVESFRDIGFVPIGQPLERNTVRLTKEGELLLSGVQVSPGYLGESGKDKFQTIDNEIWFRTGDRVVIERGQYFCKGRFDNQVKVNGYRIELMEIEAHARHMPGIAEAICFVETIGARKFLTLGITGENIPDIQAVSDFLCGKLPSYMIPKRLVHIEDMPLNRSGKIDRNRVQQTYSAQT